MRYLLLAVAVVVAVCANTVLAVEQVDKRPVAQDTALPQDSQPKEIDLGDDEGTEPAIDYGEGDRRVMPAWENYDENTGLPDNVESDLDETGQ